MTGPVAVVGRDWLRVRTALAVRPRSVGDTPCLARTVQVCFPTAEDAEKIGIEVVPVGRGGVVEAIPAAGVIDFDVARTTRLPARARGTVRAVFKGLGDRVRPGDVLALVDAADVGKAKAELLQALVQLRLRSRMKNNLAGVEGVVSGQRQREAAAAVTDAEVRVRTAEQALVNLGLPARADALKELDTGEAMKRLRFLGLPDGITTAVESTGSANLLPVVATTSGTILAASAVAGEITDPTRPLFTVTDTGVADVTLFLSPADVPLVRLGMPVHFTPDGLTDTFVGTLAWIGTAADERSRRVPIRGEFDNADGRLRDSALGCGKVVLRTEPFAVLVPADAVRTEGDCQYVFVRDPGETVAYSARPVLLGAADGHGSVEVITGVRPGEFVVTKGSTFLGGELQTTLANQSTGGGR
ncbi:putative Co/Zn/Cd efflux system membrane fusion protein [Fimbriiglobus ruber]|uniref:Putative Co/Zn/Cd efflux system membrane fusion protein n=1 Tax=Fimbriiglobus ruber TaxID=1908690 RepID=A0A225D650_9BACT|nr:putative Co/Zn/Cd efflux system membrane fusion protein [Fimbriiglobus ruber]